MDKQESEQRRHPAHPSPIDRHNQPVILLVTVTTVNGRCLLANQHSASALIGAWRSANRWVVGNYVIMPDHIHLFCAPHAWPRDTVKSWTTYWKRLAGLADSHLKSAFVYDCWDTQMRDQDHYARKLEYVAQNPVRRKLVERPEEWPYQGRLTELPWRPTKHPPSPHLPPQPGTWQTDAHPSRRGRAGPRRGVRNGRRETPTTIRPFPSGNAPRGGARRPSSGFCRTGGQVGACRVSALLGLPATPSPSARWRWVRTRSQGRLAG